MMPRLLLPPCAAGVTDRQSPLPGPAAAAAGMLGHEAANGGSEGKGMASSAAAPLRPFLTVAPAGGGMVVR